MPATLRLGFEPAAVLMVGDSYQADVEGDGWQGCTPSTLIAKTVAAISARWRNCWTA